MKCIVKKMTYVQITNHLVTKVLKIDTKRVKFRGINATKENNAKHEGKGPKNGDVFMPDESVFAGFYSKWRKLSEDKKSRVQATREEKNLTKKSLNKLSEMTSLI